MKRNALMFAVVAFALFAGSVAAQTQDPAAAMREAAKLLEQYQQGQAAVPTIDKQKLKETVPGSLLEIERESISATAVKGMPFGTTTVEATFRNENEANSDCEPFLRLRITDLGMAQAFTAFAGAVEVDKESRDGYERSVTLEGGEPIRGVEKWNKSGNRSNLEMFVAGFSVSIDASCFGAGSALRAAKELRPGLDRLAVLRQSAEAEAE